MRLFQSRFLPRGKMLIVHRFPFAKISDFMTNQHVHDRMLSLPCLFYRLGKTSQRRLKYCTAFSCFFAAAFVLNVPRLLRFPVLGFFFREYSRYLPDLSFLITFHRIFADRLDSARQIVGQSTKAGKTSEDSFR